MVSIISLSMIIQPVVPVMAAESTDAQDIEVGGSESEAVSTDVRIYIPTLTWMRTWRQLMTRSLFQRFPA